jgi:ABC-type glycerol-3-phosphate transport system substrate-binding protein
MIFGYTPIPAPVVPPDGITYDPNLAPNAMGAYKGRSGVPIIGWVDVYSDDPNTLTISALGTTFGTPTKNGKIVTYPRSFITSSRGIFYDKVTVKDSLGSDTRDIVYEIIGNPVITGCR